VQASLLDTRHALAALHGMAALKLNETRAEYALLQRVRTGDFYDDTTMPQWLLLRYLIVMSSMGLDVTPAPNQLTAAVTAATRVVTQDRARGSSAVVTTIAAMRMLRRQRFHPGDDAVNALMARTVRFALHWNASTVCSHIHAAQR
jgi:hypothetical protein